MRRSSGDHHHIRKRGGKGPYTEFSQIRHAFRRLGEGPGGLPCGGAEGSDGRHRLGTRTQSVFLSSATDQRREFYSFAYIQRPDPLGGMDLVAAQTDEIGTQLFGGEGQLSVGLDRVGVQQSGGSGSAERAGYARDIRDSSGLIVDEHQRYENRVLSERGGNRLR